MQIQSLSFRLFVSLSFVLTIFFALVTFVLEQGFRESTEQALKESLQVHLYSLLAVAEMTDLGELKMPRSLREPRFSNPSSGLYAAINQLDNTLVWRSSSAIGIKLSPQVPLKPGELVFEKDGNGRFVLHYSIIWENRKGIENRYVFTVAEDESFVVHQLDRFRVTLRTWLFFIGILLILVQYIVLRWSLKPLRIIVNDLEAIEAGKKTQMYGQYPVELKGFSDNLNALISSERAHLERYRNTLSDLAHSLKTPLAILTGCFEASAVNKAIALEQIARMNEIVEYQLQKAAAKGHKKLIAKVPVATIIDKIILSLDKVYSDKKIAFSFTHNQPCFMYAEAGDVYEIAGNLLDNAAKWCSKQVQISLLPLANNQDTPFSLLLQIEDDGVGIPAAKLDRILQRGGRADENIQGYGIGMAVVNELTTLLGGRLIAGNSEALGGMKWQVYLP